MFRSLRHPTHQQDYIWLKRRQKIRPSTIAEELEVSRPFISKAQRQAQTRIKNLINYIASVNRIILKRSSPRHGFAMGYHPNTKSQAFIFYSPTLGIQTWYEHNGMCHCCEARNTCIDTINQLASEWQILLLAEKTPSENALHLLTQIQRRLGW